MSPTDNRTCFHCNLPVPDGTAIYVYIDEVQRPMCCYGCQAVAQAMGIRSLPTLVLFKDGAVSDVQIGAVPFPRLEKWVKKRLEPKRSLASRLFGKKQDAEVSSEP